MVQHQPALSRHITRCQQSLMLGDTGNTIKVNQYKVHVELSSWRSLFYDPKLDETGERNHQPPDSSVLPPAQLASQQPLQSFKQSFENGKSFASFRSREKFCSIQQPGSSRARTGPGGCCWSWTSPGKFLLLETRKNCVILEVIWCRFLTSKN